MFRYDLAGPAPQVPTDLGRINIGPAGADIANFYQFTDKRGDTWFTIRNDPGALYRIPAGGSTYVRYGNAIPLNSNPLTGTTSATQDPRYWAWGQPMGDGDRFIFTQWGSGSLWEFDASKMATDPAQAFRLIKNIGPTNLGVATDGQNVYFTRQVTDLSNPNPHNTAVQGDDNHLMSMDLATGIIKDWGLIEDQDGRRPWRIESMSADGQGHVYMVGDWYLLEDGRNPGQPAETGTFRYDPATHLHNQTTRGLIFAVADLNGDDGPAPIPLPAAWAAGGAMLGIGAIARVVRRRIGRG
jgi:hypothetical protein